MCYYTKSTYTSTIVAQNINKFRYWGHYKLTSEKQKWTYIDKCLTPVSLSLRLLCIHIFTVYTASAIHENCQSEKCRDGETVQDEEEGKWEEGALTKCSLIILSSCIPPYSSALIPSFLKLHFLHLSTTTAAVFFYFVWLHLLSFSTTTVSLFFFFFFLGRREEEWRVTMATARWLWSYLSTVYRDILLWTCM